MPDLEISDLIVAHDPSTQQRLPVRRADVAGQLRAAGDRRAARIVDLMPATEGVLDPDQVDRLLVRTHTELQRLSEELRVAEHFAALLVPLLAAVTGPGSRSNTRPRVVDVGCGLGHVVRWLAATGVLGDVDLCGIDLNEALVTRAGELAEQEGLACRFVHGDAFDPAERATVYVSTGLLHHLPASELPGFFAVQASLGASAFCHFDVAATRLGPFGAWVFHRARMREPLGRHDGVASVRRAHSDHVLMSAAAAAPLVPMLFRPVRHSNPFCASFRPILGIAAEHVGALRDRLGRDARHLVATAPPAGRRPW